MPYIKKHRPAISHRTQFRPSPYPPRALITQRITFTNEQLQCAGRRGREEEEETHGRHGSEEPSELSDVEAAPHVKRRTAAPSNGGRSGPQQRQTLQQVRWVPSPSPEANAYESNVGPDAGTRLRQSGAMRLRSAPPETPLSSQDQTIKKPPGEPGRPNAGGHSVEVELTKKDWSKAQYNALYVSKRAVTVAPAPIFFRRL
ncbi:hypothetical protein C0992_009510 [Termitomyces sp. T32_za158]|nr:hypothetical protein C0992_009510 [Termitomyces sp. T32_za158]